MTLARTLEPSAEPVVIETPNFLMRTLTVDDASDRFAGWFLQEEVRAGLNLPEQRTTKADIVAYIQKFDQRSYLALGFVDKVNALLVGFITVHIDWRLGRYLVNTIVGEPAYRSKGMMLEITLPFRDYFFETLGLKILTATALATNKPIISYFEKTGWTLSQTLKAHTKSCTDAAMIDLRFYSITREAWRAWKLANTETVRAMALGMRRS
jgi:RimJ/RimL family protein N-acetyltransferase